ncbi:MAG: hypothetical protein ABL931_12280 [Usitatibacteraceae bacterium]
MAATGRAGACAQRGLRRGGGDHNLDADQIIANHHALRDQVRHRLQHAAERGQRRAGGVRGTKTGVFFHCLQVALHLQCGVDDRLRFGERFAKYLRHL